jgi:DNA invertase Pin-like site-specific DNA recombinase
MRVALYLRRSTDDLQPESLLIQEERLRSYAASHGYDVAAVYSDSASGRSVKHRPGFAKLLADVQQGVAFAAVVVRDVSRWGRFQNVDESAYWEMVLLFQGVRVIYAEEAFGDASRPYDSILKAMRRVCAAEFSREKSRLLQAAMASAVARGFRAAGNAPYGMKIVRAARNGNTATVRATGPRAGSRSRLKLAPANNAASRIVRQIFRLFVAESLTLTEIARRLNAERSCRGRKWRADAVREVLTNAAYAGIACATFRASDNFQEPTTIECRNAWRGLVTEETFQIAQARIAERRTRVTPEKRFAAATQDWTWHSGGEDVTWSQIAPSFPNGAVPSGNAYVKDTMLALIKRLGQSFGKAEVTERGLILKNVFELGLRYSFPRVSDGRLTWEFRMSSEEPEDATLCVGLAPPPDIRPVEMFLVFTQRLRRLGKVYRPEVVVSAFGKRNGVTYEELVRRIEHFLYSGARAENLLLQAVVGLTWTNTAAIARQLDWPETVGYEVFTRLRKRGVDLPALVWTSTRTVTWSCQECGATRERTIRGISALKADLCKKCESRKRWQRKELAFACRECGTSRPLRRPRQLDYRYSSMEGALCRACAGRKNLAAARAESKRRTILKRRAYRRIASALVKALPRRSAARVDPIAGTLRTASVPDVGRFSSLRETYDP